jgi:hypothetical protein
VRWRPEREVRGRSRPIPSAPTAVHRTRRRRVGERRGSVRCGAEREGERNAYKTYTGRSAETHHLERGDGSTGRRRRIEEKTARNRAPPRIASASPEIEERERAKNCERFGRKNKGEMARFPKFKRHSLTGGAHHPTRHPDMRCQNIGPPTRPPRGPPPHAAP